MKPNFLNKAQCLFSVFVIYLIAMLINIIATNNNSIYFGKDDGLLFRVFFTCLVSGFVFFRLSKKTRSFFIGFFIGLLSYILTFIIFIMLSEIVKNDNSGWDIPLIFDQLVAATIISIIFIIRSCRKERPQISAGMSD